MLILMWHLRLLFGVVHSFVLIQTCKSVFFCPGLSTDVGLRRAVSPFADLGLISYRGRELPYGNFCIFVTFEVHQIYFRLSCHVETIRNGRLGLRTAVWLQAKVRDHGFGLRPRRYVSSVCDDSAAEAAVVAL